MNNGAVSLVVECRYGPVKTTPETEVRFLSSAPSQPDIYRE
jgi:hypothetical protein